MCKSEIFFRLLSLTEQETEVTRDRILGDYKDMEATDARYVLVTLLTEKGLYPDQIATFLHRTARGVRHLMRRTAGDRLVCLQYGQVVTGT